MEPCTRIEAPLKARLSCSQATPSKQVSTYKMLDNKTLLLKERTRSGDTPVLQVCGGGHQRDAVRELNSAQDAGTMKK